MHLCAFYSHGPHYVRVLKRLRSRYPEARITAVVPPQFPHAPIDAWVDDIAHTELVRYSLRAPLPLLRLVRQLRAPHYDGFVTLFDSTRLRLLARLSGASDRYCVTLDGRVVSLERSLPRQLLTVASRNFRGRMAYARIRGIVQHETVVEHVEPRR